MEEYFLDSYQFLVARNQKPEPEKPKPQVHFEPLKKKQEEVKKDPKKKKEAFKRPDYFNGNLLPA